MANYDVTINYDKLRRLLITDVDMPLYKFSEKIGVSRYTVYGIRSGRLTYDLRITTLKKICEALNVDFRDYIE